MDYNLTNLGSLDFENMTAALFERFLGVRVSQFGVGPDGGREATYRGRVSRLGDEDPLDWNGYVLLQSKFRARPLGTSADQDWLIGTIERELKEWESQTSARRQENDIPNYLVIATNVVLTPAAGGGGIDRLEAHLNARTTALKMKGWLVWHHDKICRMLDNSRDIRAAYGSLLTSGDVLATLHELLQGEAANISDAVRSFTSDNLVRQRHVRLTESGGTGNLTLEQVGVDLPCATVAGTDERTAVRALIDLGDADLRPGTVDAPDATYLLMGGPGQGKSTLSNVLAQLYRVALLQGSPERNGAQPAEIIAKSLTWAARERIPLPRKRRWPIRIDLPEIDAAQPLLKTITAVVSDRVGYQVPAQQLLLWLQQWPWVLILDGFDEVAAATSRSQVFDNVTGFLAQAASRQSDLLTVITTRPQGYDNEFDIPGVQHIRLEPLTSSQAISYAGRFAREHFGDDKEERARVLDRLTEASREENVARLLQTPLQATIMTLLLSEHGHAPRDRYLLFNAYYDAIYKREAAKSKSVAGDLSDYRAEIHQLHEQCGLELQRVSEESGNFDATLPETTLRELAARNFITAGYGKEEAEQLAAGLARTATQRLVLLVPKGTGIGFEVRSLQEYMAARALTSGTEPEALARLQTIAPSAHWRNAWLFAVGRFATDRPHLQQQLLDMVRNPGADPLARRLGLGVELAAALSMDGIGATRPAVRFELLEILLEAFGLPPLPFDISEALSVLAGERTVLKGRVFGQLKRLGGEAPADAAAATYRIVEPLSTSDGPLGVAARQTLRTLRLSEAQKLAVTRPWVNQDHPEPAANRVTLASFIDGNADLSELVEPGEADTVKPFAKALRARSVSILQADPRVVLGSAKTGGERTDLPYPVADNARLAIVTALESINPHSWGAATEISDSLWRSLRRQPVGDKIHPAQRDRGTHPG